MVISTNYVADTVGNMYTSFVPCMSTSHRQEITLLQNNACELHNMPSDSTTVKMLKFFFIYNATN
jgi:hypothetical protein